MPVIQNTRTGALTIPNINNVDITLEANGCREISKDTMGHPEIQRLLQIGILKEVDAAKAPKINNTNRRVSTKVKATTRKTERSESSELKGEDIVVAELNTKTPTKETPKKNVTEEVVIADPTLSQPKKKRGRPKKKK